MRQVHLVPIALVGLFLILVLVIYGGKADKQTADMAQADSLNAGTSTPVAENTAPPRTSKGETYTNAIHEYTLRVPAGWIIDESQGVFLGTKGEVGILPARVDGMGSPGMYIVASTEQSRYELSTQEQFAEWLAAPVSSGAGQRLYKIGNISVDGISAVQVVRRTLEGDATESFHSVITWVRRNDKNYYFEFVYPDQNHLKTYRDILSSVGFK